MKISSVFNLMTDTKDLLDYFEGVVTSDQLVSRLDRLKRQSDGLLDCIYAANSSVASLLDDTLEISPSLDEPGEDNLGESITDDELENLTASDEEEKQNPAEAPIPEDQKS